jgi:hypothetical protein
MGHVPTPAQIADAERIVRAFTAAAAATGAIPVPGASFAVVAENATMVAAVSSALGVEVTVAKVVASMGARAAVNQLGKRVFLEGARAMGWFAGPLGVAGVSALGATTAALQTWSVGQLAIAIGRNGGRVLDEAAGESASRDAEDRFRRGEWRDAA